MKTYSGRARLGRGARRVLPLGGIAAIAAALLTAGGAMAAGPAASSSASKAPIKIGAITELSGIGTLPDYTDGAKAYYKQLNASGGIQGRKIQYIIADSAGDVTKANQAARRLVDSDKVVMLEGGFSFADCPVNGQFYVKSGIINSPIAFDKTCYNNPNIVPVGNGPSVGYGANMYYASEVLKLKRVCTMSFNFPGQTATTNDVIKRFEKFTKKKIALHVENVDPAQSVLTALLRVKSAKCDALVAGAQTSVTSGLVKEAARQGMNNVKFLFGPNNYDPSFLKAAGSAAKLGGGMIDTAPYTDTSIPGVKGMLRAMKAANVKTTGASAAGYTVASVTGKVLQSIKGPITRQSVTKAYKALKKPIKVPLMAQTFSYRSATNHQNPQPGIWIMGVTADGKWKVMTRKPIILPKGFITS